MNIILLIFKGVSFLSFVEFAEIFIQTFIILANNKNEASKVEEFLKS